MPKLSTEHWALLALAAGGAWWWWSRSPARNAGVGDAVSTSPVATGEQRLALGEPMANPSTPPWDIS